MTDETFADKIDRQKFRAFASILNRLRDLDGDMPIQQAVVFAWVALNEGATQKKLRDDLDMASSTSSRNLAALSRVHRLGKPGLNMIEFIEDPVDRRAKQLFLTPRGRRFVADVLDAIG